MKIARMFMISCLGIGCAAAESKSAKAPPIESPLASAPLEGTKRATAVPTAEPTGSVAEPNDPLVGKPAPDFTVQLHDGKSVHLAALKGKKAIVYFYPKDETPGCTKEACSFRDAWKEIESTGAVLIGISADDLASHKEFAKHYELPFGLASDADGVIAKAYGVPVNNGHIARQTIVIGADGNVVKVYRRVVVTAHAQELLSDLRS
jgi:peroxiredoxin Q/BCP